MMLNFYPKKLLQTISYFFIFFMFSLTLQAKTWYINKNQDGTVLQSLINAASNGDLIYFIDRADYDMKNAVIVVNKAITFQGATPIGVNLNTRGSSGTLTNLKNLTSIQIRSNNVNFNNIKLTTTRNDVVLVDARSQRYADNFLTPGYTVNDQWTGINFNNVEVNGGFYSCFAGNGMQANFTNVSFINFDRIGYINDRRTRVNGMKKVAFTKCKFQPSASSAVIFDTRGVSLDAGNTEYPIVWDGNGTKIVNCHFISTGVAFSKIQNIDIIDNLFEDKTALIDLIHIEEFSNDFLIEGNTFQGDARPAAPRQYERSRIVNMDFDLQPVDNIIIRNNTVTGEYNYFANGYGLTNITITGNNLTAATPFGTNVIDFDYYEHRNSPGEQLDANQEFVSRNITITGNTGFTNGNKGCVVRVPANGGGNINITASQFGPNKVNRIYTNDPAPLTGSGIYELRNAGNANRELASSGNNLVTKASSTTNNTTRWRVTWVPPHYYYIQNVANNRYLETHKGYTETEIKQNMAQNTWPFLGSQLSSAPKWILRKTDFAALFKILPGGNEMQSVLNIKGTSPGLIFHKRFVTSGPKTGQREVVEPDNFGKWWFMWQSSSKTSNGKLVDDTFSKELTVFPNPASGIISLYYEDDASPIIEVNFYSVTGVKVKTKNVSSHVNTHVDISNLSSGVYLAKASNGTTKKIFIK